jgi:dTDP-4-amino-4,6-dideoxygalactose transaminase
MNKIISVTKTFLPPLDEYNSRLKRAWDTQWITNRGQLVIELEDKLKRFLETDNILITNNGTVPLQIALKLLGNKGDIITTPFSYVATSASIVWENCKPVFVDIHPEYLTIDETKIEEAITGNTTAILATHVFGNPCNVEAINTIAKKNNLKVIYDAAHCFGVKYNRQSIFNFGDISTCSFHATKLFHCGEGGALFSNDKELLHQMFYSHNFGHNGTLDFHGLGINGKISELQAAMGLAVFPYLDHIIFERKKIVELYNSKLSSVGKLKLRANTEWNYSYYPVIFGSETELSKTEEMLKQNNIIPRRYFYPSLNTISYLRGQQMPVSESISKRILCLPLYVGLTKEDVELVCELVNTSVPNKSATTPTS